MISIVRSTSRNVKHWQNGDMCLRWTTGGMPEAERQFRKIIGYQRLAALAIVVENDLAATGTQTTLPTTSHQPHHHDRAGRYARNRSLISGPPPPSSTGSGTTSKRFVAQPERSTLRTAVGGASAERHR